MTIIVTEPAAALDQSDIKGKNVEEVPELHLDAGFITPDEVPELHLDAGFITPDVNSFGHAFRDYRVESQRSAGVEEFCRLNHTNQTYDFACKKRQEYGTVNRTVMSIWECVELLNGYVDESDPDLDEPQIVHLLQTAEAIRMDYPDQDWLHLTGLIHDLGKVLLHPDFGSEPQWAAVGDTFPLGCAFDPAIAHYKHFNANPDSHDPRFNTKYGVYSPNCGLEHVVMSWGHDEYMYMVAKANNTTLPPTALGIIRFHSFYAWHKGGAYTHLMNQQDEETLKWVNIFSKYDLYSKSKVRIDVEAVKPYYLSLIHKYFPAKLRW